MAEAESKPSGSMEDILQSIKRIIEDESDTQAKPAAPAGDVLDLTQVIKDDGTITTIPPLPAMGAAKPEPAPETAKPVIAAPAPIAAPAAAQPQPSAPSSAPKPAPKPKQLEDALVSDQAVQAALAALKPLAESANKESSVPHAPPVALRSGTTVEDLMLEALKPMLKTWLDEHLPLIVQKIVEKEVKRIVKFNQE
jgi:cell pole-organizing protein PopZ